MPRREKVENQGDRCGDGQWNNGPGGENIEAVYKPKEDAQVKEGAETVYDRVSSPLLDRMDILAVGKRVLPVQIPEGQMSKTAIIRIGIVVRNVLYRLRR